MIRKKHVLLGIGTAAAISAIALISLLVSSREFVGRTPSTDSIPVGARPLSTRNPTSWEFDVSKAEMKECIEATFGEFAWRGMILVFKEDNNVFAEKFLNAPGNESDAYLYNHHRPIGASPVYHVDGKGLEHLAEFQLHLSPLSEKRTRVEVITHKAEVIAGMTSGWLNPHGPANIYVPVKSTSLEEYEILLRLGGALKVSGMPSMISPE